jgi:hypothetical protein
LPRAGGVDDQDPRFIEACDVIEAEVAKMREVTSGSK